MHGEQYSSREFNLKTLYPYFTLPTFCCSLSLSPSRSFLSAFLVETILLPERVCVCVHDFSDQLVKKSFSKVCALSPKSTHKHVRIFQGIFVLKYFSSFWNLLKTLIILKNFSKINLKNTLQYLSARVLKYFWTVTRSGKWQNLNFTRLAVNYFHSKLKFEEVFLRKKVRNKIKSRVQ